MSFFTFSVPSGALPSTDKAPENKPQTEEKGSVLRPGIVIKGSPYFGIQ